MLLAFARAESFTLSCREFQEARELPDRALLDLRDEIAGVGRKRSGDRMAGRILV